MKETVRDSHPLHTHRKHSKTFFLPSVSLCNALLLLHLSWHSPSGSSGRSVIHPYVMIRFTRKANPFLRLPDVLGGKNTDMLALPCTTHITAGTASSHSTQTHPDPGSGQIFPAAHPSCAPQALPVLCLLSSVTAAMSAVGK